MYKEAVCVQYPRPGCSINIHDSKNFSALKGAATWLISPRHTHINPNNQIFATFCRAMLCIARPRPSCGVCLSALLSVGYATSVYRQETSKHIPKLLSPSVSPTISVPNIMAIFRRKPSNGGVKCMWGMKIVAILTNISLYLGNNAR